MGFKMVPRNNARRSQFASWYDELRVKHASLPAGVVNTRESKMGAAVKCPGCGALGPCYFVVRCGECLKGPWGKVVLFTHCAECGGPAKALMEHWKHQIAAHPELKAEKPPA